MSIKAKTPPLAYESGIDYYRSCILELDRGGAEGERGGGGKDLAEWNLSRIIADQQRRRQIPRNALPAGEKTMRDDRWALSSLFAR